MKNCAVNQDSELKSALDNGIINSPIKKGLDDFILERKTLVLLTQIYRAATCITDCLGSRRGMRPESLRAGYFIDSENAIILSIRKWLSFSEIRRANEKVHEPSSTCLEPLWPNELTFPDHESSR